MASRLWASRLAALVVASCVAGPLAHAEESVAAALAAVYERVLADPTDTDANMEYARLAEQAGQPRKALATYERILLYEPDNREAREGLFRLRKQLKPDNSLITLDTGVGFESNPLLLSSDFENDLKAFANLRVEDERNLGDQRWRTVLLGNIEYYSDTYELDYGYFGGQTGPMYETAGGVHIDPFIGGGVSSLENAYYFTEGFAGFTTSGYLNGAYQILRVSGGYRTFAEDQVSTNGFFADAIARISRPAVLTDSDVLVFVPHVRWSAVGGTDIGYGPNDLKPGKYLEWGGGVMYYDQVADWLTLGAGFNIEQTLYSDYETIEGSDRTDWTFTPAASAVFNGALGFQSDLAFDYRYDWNESNDSYYDYGNHVVTARVVTRF